MPTRVIVLGAGFGGLELSTILSETLGDRVDILLVDRSDAFVFGFSKLDVMFGFQTPEGARHLYRDIVRPGIRFLRTTVREIDPVARRIVTDDGAHEADILAIALGADLDPGATPGLDEAGNEFYTVAGAVALGETLPTFTQGHAIVGVTSQPFKCPPAPSETAFLLHDHLVRRGIRGQTEISVVMPFGIPIPPSPDTSRAILAGFAERGIRFIADNVVSALDPGRRVAILSGGEEIPYGLFLGVPVHRAPQVVVDSGLTVDGWIPVDRATLATKYPGVYAIGDVTSVGTPKAGVFAESAARVVAAEIIADLRGSEKPSPFEGLGSCYLEFGQGQVGRVDVVFLREPRPTGTFQAPSAALVAEKAQFGSSRVRRWFGREWRTKA